MHLWLIRICGFKLCTETFHLGDACVEATAGLDDIFFAIEPEAIGGKGGISAGGSGTTEVVLAEGDREGRVGREDELFIALAPVSGECIRSNLYEQVN
jgi:hypothetical protein